MRNCRIYLPRSNYEPNTVNDNSPQIAGLPDYTVSCWKWLVSEDSIRLLYIITCSFLKKTDFLCAKIEINSEKAAVMW